MSPVTSLAEELVAETPDSVFDSFESEVRSYCRVFPAVFTSGRGSHVHDAEGRRWLDFLSGAGALNYGHNHPLLKDALLRYIEGDGIVSALDMHTQAKEEFLRVLNDVLLRPRGLSYKCQFCGPTGTNAVEAALKLATKVTGRKGVVSFSNSYHGMSAGSMSVSSSFRRRNEAYLQPGWVSFMPFEGFTGQADELEYVKTMLTRDGSGIAPPAAFILELVQGEGGVNVASSRWVRQVQALCRQLGALLIVDDIQAGCGRTGRFFSFEHHGIVPDLVCVSKSISGFGLPMSLLLIGPELDVWRPGEHNGTFRGFTYAHVTAQEMLRQFWGRPEFPRHLAALDVQLSGALDDLEENHPVAVRGTSRLGLFAGIRTANAAVADKVQRRCFQRGLLVETCGADGATVKLLPPLTITPEELEEGLEILDEALGHCRLDA